MSSSPPIGHRDLNELAFRRQGIISQSKIGIELRYYPQNQFVLTPLKMIRNKDLAE